MTDVDYLSYNGVDETFTLSSDEQNDYSDRTKILNDLNKINNNVEFSCLVTLDQLWSEINNLSGENDSEIKLAQQKAIRSMTSIKYNSILHVFSRTNTRVSFESPVQLNRCGDIVLGFRCKEPGPVEIHVGSIYKFTKECKEGLNFLEKDEVIPLLALQYHQVCIKDFNVSDIVYGNILHDSLVTPLRDFYASSENPTIYRLQHGMDIDQQKKFYESIRDKELSS